MALLTFPQKPGQPILIQCDSKQEWSQVQAFLVRPTGYLVAMPPEQFRDARLPPAPAPRGKRLTKENGRRMGPPMLDQDRAVRYIESQRDMLHSTNGVIADQVPEGIRARIPGTRRANPDYNSANNGVLRARKAILARIGGSFVPVSGRKGWVRHQR